MKKALKIIGAIILALAVIGWLLPDSPTTTTGTDNASLAAVAGSGAESKPQIEVLQADQTVDNQINTRVIHAKVKNNSKYLASYVELKSVYYNAEGKIVGTGLGNTLNLAPGATKTIDVLAMGIEGANKWELELGNVLFE